MAADGMDSTFMSIFGEFLEGYAKCAKMAGTTPEQFQYSIGRLIKVRKGMERVQLLGRESYMVPVFYTVIEDLISMTLYLRFQ